MRGCLFVVVLAGLVLGAGAWFGAPLLAEGAVRTALIGAGLETNEPDRVAVRVELASPLDLVAGRADRVTVRTASARFASLAWSAATIELTSVDLVERAVEEVDVELERPGLDADDGTGLAATSLTARGPAGAAATRIAVPLDQVVHRLRMASGQIGPIPDDLRFVAPNRVIDGSQTFGATLVVTNGSLVLRPDLEVLPAVELFRPADDLGFVLSDALVRDGALILLGTLDVETWLE